MARNRIQLLSSLLLAAVFVAPQTALGQQTAQPAAAAGPEGYTRAMDVLKKPQKVEFINGKKVFKGTPPCLSWIDPDKEPRAVVLCVHGCGLHNGSYEAFAKRLAPNGIAVYAVDVRGFGSWQEAKGHEDIDFDGCLSDVHDTLRILHKVHPKLPIYILGESMGGAIALREASLFPELVSGLISCVPAGDRFRSTSTDLKVAAKFFLGPNRKFKIGEQIIEQATENPDLRKAWAEDPLARMKLSPKELVQFNMFCNGNKKAAENVKTIPVLILQGKCDNLIKPESTYEIFDKLATTDKQLLVVENQEHLIFEESQFNDPIVNDLVLDMVLSWIDRPLPKHKWEVGRKAADLYKESCALPAKETKKKKEAVSETVAQPPVEPPPAATATRVMPQQSVEPVRPVDPAPPAISVRAKQQVDQAASDAAANAAADAAAAEAFRKMGLP